MADSDHDSEIILLNENRGNKTLVEETPLPTPIDTELHSADVVIPEMQDSKVSNDGFETEKDLDLELNKMAGKSDQHEPPSLLDELNEVELEEQLEARRLAMEKEKAEVEKRAKLLAQQTRLEAEEHQLLIMKKQVSALMEARKKANESAPVWNEEVIGEDATTKQVKQMLDMLNKEAEERERKERELREKEEREAEERRELEERHRREIGGKRA